MRNRRQNVQQVIRSLKRRYGDRVIFNSPSDSPDFKTGSKKTSIEHSIELRQVIVLPEQADRQFIQRLASIVANREFSYGGYFDASVRRFIVDGRDLIKANYEPKDKDFLVWNYRRYEITKMEVIPDNQGWLITAKEVKGNRPLYSYFPIASNRLVFSQAASGVL